MSDRERFEAVCPPSDLIEWDETYHCYAPTDESISTDYRDKAELEAQLQTARWKGWQAAQSAQEPVATETELPVRGKVWKRSEESSGKIGGEWVLELTAELNGELVVSRHTEPITTPLLDVLGLPSLYTSPPLPSEPTAETADHWLQKAHEYQDAALKMQRVLLAIQAAYPLTDNMNSAIAEAMIAAKESK